MISNAIENATKAPAKEYDSWVRVYCNVEGTWTQVGQNIYAENVALSSDGTVVAVGDTDNDDNGWASGHVQLYRNVDGIWTQIGQDIDGENAGDISGASVALSSDGSVVAIGAYWNDGNGENSGHVRLYRDVNDTWTQIGEAINGEAAGDWSGYSVALSSDGSVVAIGAIRDVVIDAMPIDGN